MGWLTDAGLIKSRRSHLTSSAFRTASATAGHVKHRTRSRPLIPRPPGVPRRARCSIESVLETHNVDVNLVRGPSGFSIGPTSRSSRAVESPIAVNA